jgi:stress response protein YsnF
MRTVIGLFGNAGEARRALDELHGLGYADEKISVVTNVSSQEAIESRKAMGLQSLSLADVGKVATSGPLRDVLIKQPAGALGAALQLLGLTPELADHYVSGVRHGETLETLTVEDRDSDRVLAIMRRRSAIPETPPEEEGLGAEERIRSQEEHERQEEQLAAQTRAREAEAAAAAAAAQQAAQQQKEEALAKEASMKEKEIRSKVNGHALEMDERDEERIIPIIREEIRVGRRTVERGGVRVTSHIVERPVSEQVHLRETHVDIERRAVDRPLRGDEGAFSGATVEMVEMADEPVVSKQARVVEEVIVRKHVEDHTATISDQIRSTEVEFGKLRAFDADEYRRYFDDQRTGESFDSHLHAFQFGHGLHHHKKAAADRWEDVEPYARERWEAENAGTWDKFQDSIRHAWLHAKVN